MSNIGCPYRTRNIGTNKDHCPIINKSVEGFVMCECDWESCPEYQEQRKKEEQFFEPQMDCYSLECESRDCTECSIYSDFMSAGNS